MSTRYVNYTPPGPSNCNEINFLPLIESGSVKIVVGDIRTRMQRYKRDMRNELDMEARHFVEFYNMLLEAELNGFVEPAGSCACAICGAAGPIGDERVGVCPLCGVCHHKNCLKDSIEVSEWDGDPVANLFSTLESKVEEVRLTLPAGAVDEVSLRELMRSSKFIKQSLCHLCEWCSLVYHSCLKETDEPCDDSETSSHHAEDGSDTCSSVEFDDIW